MRGKLESMGPFMVDNVVLLEAMGIIAAKAWGGRLESDTNMVAATNGISVAPDDMARNGNRMAGAKGARRKRQAPFFRMVPIK